MSEYALEGVALAICLQERFTLVSPVGKGAYKETFAVSDGAGRKVALKVLKPGCTSERNEREVAAMKACSHPNVAELLKLGSIIIDGVPHAFMTERFLAGGTLEDKLKVALLDRQAVLDIGEALIQAVANIASNGLVHRDFKPANIMFDGDGNPVISDFGVVRDLGKSSLTQTYFASGPGTPYFAAPEQLNNDKSLIDWRTDQFALAVTLAIAHFGSHPFLDSGESEALAVDRVAARLGPSKNFKKEAQRAGLESLVKMLSTWPVGRYRTPVQLLTAWRVQ